MNKKAAWIILISYCRLLASFGLPERAKYGVEQGSARPTGFLDITESALALKCPCECPETLPFLCTYGSISGLLSSIC